MSLFKNLFGGAKSDTPLPPPGVDPGLWERSLEGVAAGDVVAQRGIGAIYYDAGNYEQALKYYRMAAEQGDARSQFLLGVIYHHHIENVADAVQWYERAANQGHALAQRELGDIVFQGIGVPADQKLANEWWHKAALQGDDEAQYNLGTSYHEGTGLAVDETEAVRWYQAAAEQGHGLAQFNMGVHLANGIGAARDMVRAYAWATLAVAGEVEDAEELLNAIGARLTADGREEAARIARGLVQQK